LLAALGRAVRLVRREMIGHNPDRLT
jgi:hypothetical protein